MFRLGIFVFSKAAALAAFARYLVLSICTISFKKSENFEGDNWI